MRIDGGLRPAQLVRQAREDAELTQLELAERAGVAASTVSLFEKGRRQPSLAVLERLLAAAGVQIHVELQPLWQQVDAAIDELAALSPQERWQRVSVWIPGMTTQLARVPHVVVGAAAAFLHGAPLPVPEWQVVMTGAALEEMQRTTSILALRPSVLTEGRFFVPQGEGWLQTTEVEVLPHSVALDVDGVSVRVLTLLALEDTDPYVRRVLERLRLRRQREGAGLASEGD